MAVVYQIQDVSRTLDNRQRYLVHFWLDEASFQTGAPPDVMEEFIYQLNPVNRRIVRDGRRFRKRASDGEFIDWDTVKKTGAREPEWEYEDVAHDVRDEFHGHIERFIQRVIVEKGVRGNLVVGAGVPTDDQDDPLGVVKRGDIQDLKLRAFHATTRQEVTR